MRILLDECVPVQVRNALVGHDVSTAQQRGWGGISNGELLQRAEQGGFSLFIVADKNLRYQQNLKDEDSPSSNSGRITGRRWKSTSTRSRPLPNGLSLENMLCWRIQNEADGGWVNDSEPEAEFQETVNQSKAMLKAVALPETFAKGK